jgi:hypothetical protein
MIRKLFSNTIISTPININGNISYEGILKHRKYRCHSLVLFILFIMNYDEGIARESFSFKIILRSPLYNHLSSNISVIFI